MQGYVVELGAYSVATEDGNEILLSRDSYQSYLKLKEDHLKEEAKNLMDLADDAMREVDEKWQQVEDMFHRLKTKNPFDDQANTKVSNTPFRVIDDFENSLVKKRPRLFTLKRTIVGAVLGFGLFAAIKEVPKLFMNQDHHITVESPKESIRTLENDKKDFSVKRKYKKASKKLNENSIKMDEFISLRDTNLYYTSQEGNPSVKSRNLDCDSYKIRYVSIISKNQKDVLDVFKIDSNDSSLTVEQFKNNYQSLYGKDIHFQMNVDGYQDGKLVCKKIGWTSMDNIKKKRTYKVLKKTR